MTVSGFTGPKETAGMLRALVFERECPNSVPLFLVAALGGEA